MRTRLALLALLLLAAAPLAAQDEVQDLIYEVNNPPLTLYPHQLFSSTHSDTVAGSPILGDMIWFDGSRWTRGGIGAHINGEVWTIVNGSPDWAAAPGGGASTGASYITKVAEAGLSNEFALGSLGTGILINTTTTGVPTILSAQTCTNQFVRSYNASGTATCASVANADIAAATIDLTTKVTGVLPAANGGNGNGFFAVAGPDTSTKTFTFPNASANVLTDNAAVTVAQGGTGIASGANGGVLGFTGTTTVASSALLASNSPVLGGGAGATPKTVAGITSDGTSKVTLGVAGTSVGSVGFNNATSGTITMQPVTGALGTVTLSLPALTATVATVPTGTGFPHITAGAQDAAAKTVDTADITNSAVDLTTKVTGKLPYANLADGSGQSIVGKTGAGAGANTNLASSADGQYVRRMGGTVGFTTGTRLYTGTNCSKATTTDVTSTVTETVFYSCLITAGDVGANDVFQFVVAGDILYNDTDATRTLKIKVRIGCAAADITCTGGQVLYDSTVSPLSSISAVRAPWSLAVHVQAMGATNSQAAFINAIVGNRAAATTGSGQWTDGGTMTKMFLCAPTTINMASVTGYFVVTATWSTGTANTSFRATQGYAYLIQP